ncbi:MAG: flagellar motor switch phosphatase FliY [Clostridiales bacterium]|nr:flagellar motor switch phosphatase FliY [Clostridiales bacterium]
MTENKNDQMLLTDVERDVIGEVMNISMGSAATALSTILDKKVNITTPRIEICRVEEFEFSYLEPVVGVMIKYIEGISGSNMLILREADMKAILRQLLALGPDEEVEFDEISISAICEIMNQMMGSASSSLASFLGISVNISTPEVMDTTSQDSVRKMFAVQGEYLVSIKFDINVDGLIESEFISAMEPQLAKEIIGMSLGATEVTDVPEEIPEEQPKAEEAAVVEEPVRDTAPIAASSTVKEQKKQQVQAVPYTYQQLETEDKKKDAADSNLDLLLSVPIQLTVELGRTKKKIKEIADYTVGTIVELDRQAGDQVDIIANGKLIARGDVVVVDDYYSVRITEILKARDSVADIE